MQEFSPAALLACREGRIGQGEETGAAPVPCWGRAVGSEEFAEHPVLCTAQRPQIKLKEEN